MAVNWEGAEAKTDPDTVIEASRLSLTFTTRDGPVEALSEVDLQVNAANSSP